jgi:hypothetical protein
VLLPLTLTPVLFSQSTMDGAPNSLNSSPTTPEDAALSLVLLSQSPATNSLASSLTTPKDAASNPQDAGSETPSNAPDGVRPNWKKNGKRDPIFRYVVDILVPCCVEDTAAGKVAVRAEYVKTTLWPMVNEKFQISGPNGYNVANFMVVS